MYYHSVIPSVGGQMSNRTACSMPRTLDVMCCWGKLDSSVHLGEMWLLDHIRACFPQGEIVCMEVLIRALSLSQAGLLSAASQAMTPTL